MINLAVQTSKTNKKIVERSNKEEWTAWDFDCFCSQQTVTALGEDKVILIFTLITWQELLMLCVFGSVLSHFNYRTLSKSQQHVRSGPVRPVRLFFFHFSNLWCAFIIALGKQRWSKRKMFLLCVTTIKHQLHIDSHTEGLITIMNSEPFSWL